MHMKKTQSILKNLKKIELLIKYALACSINRESNSGSFGIAIRIHLLGIKLLESKMYRQNSTYTSECT